MADFQKLLSEQKQEQDKEQVAISEAAQTYALEIQKEQGLGQDFIKSAGISNAAVSVVQNFQQDLDLIADADFTGFKDIVEKYKVLLSELEGNRRFDNKEKKYIKDIVAPVLAEVYPLADTFARVRFGLRDFVKQFKPIKLAARVFGNVPILGTAVQKKIERQEAGEQELRRAERKRGQDIAREARRGIEEQLDTGGATTTSPAESLIQEIDQDVKQVKDVVVETRTELDPKSKKGAANEEAIEEQQNIEQDRYEEERGLLEMIAESTYESNENLKKLVDAEEGILDDIGSGASAALGAGVGVAGTAGAIGAAKALKSKPGGIVQKSKDAIKKGASKAGNLAKTAVRGAGRVFLPLAAALAIFDTAASAANADEILNKSEEDLTLRDRASAGVGGLLEGLSFGLIKKDKVAKFLAGENTNVEEQSLVPNASEVNQATEVTGPVKDMVNINSKRTVVRTELETSSLESALEKLTENFKGNTIVNAPNQNITSANSTNLLPDLSNKNIDKSIIEIKNIY